MLAQTPTNPPTTSHFSSPSNNASSHYQPTPFDNTHLTSCSLNTGQINRAKNQQAGVISTPSPTYSPSRTFLATPVAIHKQPIDATVYITAYARGGNYHGRGRGGYRVGKAPVHRNRTLVLNGASAPSNTNDVASPSHGASHSWVTRNDRHLQLINSSVYQEQTEARAKAIEQTRVQRLQQKENKERSRLLNHLRQTGEPSVVSADSTAVPIYKIDVHGIQFAVVKNGSKLVKLPGAPRNLLSADCTAAHSHTGDSNAPKATPKFAVVGGVKFHRTKNGNMYRQAIVKAQRYVAPPGDDNILTRGTYRRSGAVNKVNVPCKTFSTTGISVQQLPDSLPWLLVMCSGFRFRTSITDHCNSYHRFLPQGPNVPLHAQSRKGCCLQRFPAERHLCFRRPL